MLGAGAGIHAPELSLIGGGTYTYNGPEDVFASATWSVISNNSGGLISGKIYTSFADGSNNGTNFYEDWALETPDFDVTTVQVRLDIVSGDTPTLGGVLASTGTWYDLTTAGASWSVTSVSPSLAGNGDYTLRLRIKGTTESEVSGRYDLTAVF